MATDPAATLNDAQAVQVLRQGASSTRRVHNRGLTEFLQLKVSAGELPSGAFRPEDLRRLVKDSYPAADAAAIGNALASLARDGNKGIERVGSNRSGLYRVADKVSPEADDDVVIENALRALADLEALVHRYRAVLPALASLRKALK